MATSNEWVIKVTVDKYGCVSATSNGEVIFTGRDSRNVVVSDYVRQEAGENFIDFAIRAAKRGDPRFLPIQTAYEIMS